MEEQTTARQSKRRYRLPRSYVAVWGVLATAAGAYLAVALGAPGLLGLPAYSSGVGVANVDGSNGTGRTARRLAERLSSAQLEIAKLRTQLSRQQEVADARASAKKVLDAGSGSGSGDPRTGANTQVSQATATPDAAQPQVTTVATTTILNNKDGALARQGVAPAVNEVAVATAQIEKARAAGDARPASSGIETGSITVPPPPTRAPLPPLGLRKIAATTPSVAAVPAVVSTNTQPVAPIAAPASGPEVGVRVATGPSVDALRLRWTTMVGSVGGVMAGLEPHVVASTTPGALGPTYDLIAGPLKTLSDAQRICNAASVRSTICEIRKLDGTRAL